MAEQQSPAFQFYFKDWRSSKRVSRMSFKERGMYLELLIEQWDKGPLPLLVAELAESIGAKETDFKKSWPTLKSCFLQTAEGWVNERLERERVKQKLRNQRAADWGKDGADKRWAAHNAKNGQPIGTPLQPNSFALSLATASAVASASALATANRVSLIEDDIATRGAWLVERYGELYSQLRRGAHFRQRPNLDWTEACDLCRHWDNARLEKLAAVVLTTDDDWIAKTDRSFKIFAMKATWADDRLTAAEQS